MQYIDVRIRMPIAKLGQFVQDLPAYAQMVGYDKLGNDLYAEKAAKKPNGEYQPLKGSTVEKVLEFIAREPVLPRQVIAALKSHKKQAVTSAIGGLSKRGLIIRQKDGTYARKN